MCRGSRFAGHLLRSPCGQLWFPSLRLAWWPEVLARRASGECAGAHDSPDTCCVHPAGSSGSPHYGWPGGLKFWPAGRPVNVPGLTIRRTLAAFTLRAALVPLITVGLGREHEVHGLAVGGPVEP